ncbi:MAG: sigma-54-dependent Fis family transcriptional regulator [Bacteroidaceae bacterium]|nr:sigma-54-dependent Fis family transcriptional regulator [Bacteroidaceae bacterium]
MVTPEIQQVKLRFGIIGNAEGLSRAIDIAMQVAPTDLSVLITGESGVGKEAFPKIIHEYSRRKHSRKYIAVNCGAIPEGTIDSELFGHEKGAFTGAIGERQGYFGEANGGTIFLDEVGELPLATQARLLRVLESGEYIRVGSSKVEKTDVRIVAATNVNLMQAIAEGRFREDLFYRLNTVPITIPPLRERGSDIALLFRKFANDFAETYRMPAIQLTEEAQRILLAYPWPGNVRQLKNITEQISIIERKREITPDILQQYIPVQEGGSRMPALLKGNAASAGHTFESEREILYQILFDLRRDMTELKRLVHSNVGQMQHSQPMDTHQTASHVPFCPAEEMPLDAGVPLARPMTPTVSVSHQHTVSPSLPHVVADDDIQDTEEYVEESLSLNELERETIRKALEKHNGRRKRAAQELNISERMLYRKIKEYGLE